MFHSKWLAIFTPAYHMVRIWRIYDVIGFRQETSHSQISVWAHIYGWRLLELFIFLKIWVILLRIVILWIFLLIAHFYWIRLLLIHLFNYRNLFFTGISWCIRSFCSTFILFVFYTCLFFWNIPISFGPPWSTVKAIFSRKFQHFSWSSKFLELSCKDEKDIFKS